MSRNISDKRVMILKNTNMLRNMPKTYRSYQFDIYFRELSMLNDKPKIYLGYGGYKKKCQF